MRFVRVQDRQVGGPHRHGEIAHVADQRVGDAYDEGQFFRRGDGAAVLLRRERHGAGDGSDQQ